MMVIFSYAPYELAEGLQLSGIEVFNLFKINFCWFECRLFLYVKEFFAVCRINFSELKATRTMLMRITK